MKIVKLRKPESPREPFALGPNWYVIELPTAHRHRIEAVAEQRGRSPQDQVRRIIAAWYRHPRRQR